MTRGRLIRLGCLLAVAGLAITVGLAAREGKVLRRLELTSVDARFALRGRETPPRNIVIVGIDARTLGELGTYPFRRSIQARLIDRLRRAGARVIAEDIEYGHPTVAREDKALLNSIARARRVVLGTGHQWDNGAPVILSGARAIRRRGASIGAGPAFASDQGGSLRRLYYARYGIRAFAVEVAARYQRRPISAKPFPAEGAWVDYSGPAGTYPTYSYVDVLRGDVPASRLRDTVAVVGGTDPLLQDQHPTPPSGELMSGPEIQANAIATVLKGLPLRTVSSGWTTFLVLVMALVVPLLGMRLGGIACAFAGAAFAAIGAAATQVAFNSGTVLQIVPPAFALLTSTVGTMIVASVAHSRERRQLRELFASYSPRLVHDVLAGRRAPIAANAIIGGYQVDDVIGRGGMGVVYKATQVALGREVALKLINPVFAGDPIFRARFRGESRAAAAIEHPNVIPVYEAGEDDGLLYIAMRFVDGIDLGTLVERGGPLPPTQAILIVSQIAAALDAAHAKQLVHRDVKPANILLTTADSPHAYLTDFGLARHVGGGDGLTEPDDWVGTVDYLAPEQLLGRPIDGRVDVYALAGVLHYCLTGRPPYPAENDAAKMLAHLNAPPPAASSLRPDLPEAIDQTIAHGMAKNPDDRAPTAQALAGAASSAFEIPLNASPSIGDAATSPPG